MNYLNIAAQIFLIAPLPDNWEELDDDQQGEFLRDHAWEPFETWEPCGLWDVIEDTATYLANTFGDKS